MICGSLFGFGYPIFFLLFTVFVFVFVRVVVAIVVVAYICNIAFTRYLVMESQARTDAGKPRWQTWKSIGNRSPGQLQ